MRHFFPFPGSGWFFWFHFLGAGLMALFWIGLLGLLIWALLRLLSGGSRMSVPASAPPWQSYGTPPVAGPSAIEILQQRYARGEIDAETYQQMLERLQASMPDGSYGGSSSTL